MNVVQTEASAVDAALMRRMQADDDMSAFEQLYDRQASRAYRVARSVCVNAEDAEEAVQEAFLSIWRRRQRYQAGAGTVRAWSMAIVRHAAIDVVRYHGAAKRPILVKEQADAPGAEAGSVADAVEACSAATALHAALARLPDLQAEAISLAFFGELSHTEVAEQLHLPPGTVKGRIRLGLEKLRSDLT